MASSEATYDEIPPSCRVAGVQGMQENMAYHSLVQTEFSVRVRNSEDAIRLGETRFSAQFNQLGESRLTSVLLNRY